jgi:hypothetical protein
MVLVKERLYAIVNYRTISCVGAFWRFTQAMLDARNHDFRLVADFITPKEQRPVTLGLVRDPLAYVVLRVL